jgi:hypothetical protein
MCMRVAERAGQATQAAQARGLSGELEETRIEGEAGVEKKQESRLEEGVIYWKR